MRRGIRNILIAAVAGATVGVAPDPQQESPCKGWPTEEFFREATVAKVVACLDTGADPTAQDGHRGRTALHIAAGFNSNAAVVALLLDRGAEVNAQDEYGRTPLDRAALEENAVAVALLLDRGAEVNTQGWHGLTPLHWAAGGSPAVVALLLDRGADATLRDNDNKLPVDLADENKALQGTDVYRRLKDASF